jgi:futalosine hydrolase
MRVLIVAATSFEIRLLKDSLTLLEPEQQHLTQYIFQNTHVDVLIPGIGIMVTAFHLGNLLSKNSYDCAINAGIAGAYTFDLSIGEVVEVVRENIPEMGVQEEDRFVSIQELGFTHSEQFPLTSMHLENTIPMNSPALNRLRKTTGNTIHTLHTEQGVIKQLLHRSPADIETMEGASFLFGCLRKGIPNVQIRTISNYVGERDKTRWNVALAVKNLNEVLFRLMEELNEGMRE